MISCFKEEAKLLAITVLLFTCISCRDECLKLGGNCGNSETEDSVNFDDIEISDNTADYFELDIQKDSSTDEEAASKCTHPESATTQQVTALKAVNDYRLLVGLSCIDENEIINKAAQAHAEYYVLHYNDYQKSGLSPHQENSAWADGFTGENFWNRMSHFGYSGAGGWEIIAFVNNPSKAVDEWMETLYHRLPIIHPYAKEFGYGNAGKGMIKIDVMDFGQGGLSTDLDYVLYPADGQINVPKTWDGMESPQPPPPPSGYPSGPIITVTFGSKLGFKISGHELTDDTGNAVDHMFLAPFANSELNIKKDQMLDNEIAMYSNKPLSPKAKYNVSIAVERGGKNLEIKWSFTTKY
jgi:uncharacterized protein YkwD